MPRTVYNGCHQTLELFLIWYYLRDDKNTNSWLPKVRQKHVFFQHFVLLNFKAMFFYAQKFQAFELTLDANDYDLDENFSHSPCQLPYLLVSIWAPCKKTVQRSILLFLLITWFLLYFLLQHEHRLESYCHIMRTLRRLLRSITSNMCLPCAYHHRLAERAKDTLHIALFLSTNYRLVKSQTHFLQFTQAPRSNKCHIIIMHNILP